MGSMALLLRGGTLIDGRGGAPRTDAALLIDEGRIRAVGSRAEVESGLDLEAPGFRIFDVTGKTIMPGLIDAHCHINYGEV